MFNRFCYHRSAKIWSLISFLSSVGIVVPNPHELGPPFILADFDLEKFTTHYQAWIAQNNVVDNSIPRNHFNLFFTYLDGMENSPFWSQEQRDLFNSGVDLQQKYQLKVYAARAAEAGLFPITSTPGLSFRTIRCLKSVNIHTEQDLVSKSESDLLKIPNFGRKSLNEVKEGLASRGFTLPGCSVRL